MQARSKCDFGPGQRSLRTRATGRPAIDRRTL